MVTAVLFGLFAVLLLIGAPIAVCLGMSSVAAMIVMGAGRPLNIVLGTVPQLVSATAGLCCDHQIRPDGNSFLHPWWKHHGEVRDFDPAD